MHSENETSFSSSYEPKVQQTCEDEIESAKHNEENVLKNDSENFPSVISDGILDEKELTFYEYELSSKPFCEDKQCPECGGGSDCVQ